MPVWQTSVFTKNHGDDSKPTRVYRDPTGRSLRMNRIVVTPSGDVQGAQEVMGTHECPKGTLRDTSYSFKYYGVSQGQLGVLTARKVGQSPCLTAELGHRSMESI